MNRLVPASSGRPPPLVAAAGERASVCFSNSSQPTSATRTHAARLLPRAGGMIGLVRQHRPVVDCDRRACACRGVERSGDARVVRTLCQAAARRAARTRPGLRKSDNASFRKGFQVSTKLTTRSRGARNSIDPAGIAGGQTTTRLL